MYSASHIAIYMEKSDNKIARFIDVDGDKFASAAEYTRAVSRVLAHSSRMATITCAPKYLGVFNAPLNSDDFRRDFLRFKSEDGSLFPRGVAEPSPIQFEALEEAARAARAVASRCSEATVPDKISAALEEWRDSQQSRPTSRPRQR